MNGEVMVTRDRSGRTNSGSLWKRLATLKM